MLQGLICGSLLVAGSCSGGSQSPNGSIEAGGGTGAPAQLLEGLPAPSKLTTSLAGTDTAAIVVNGGVKGDGGPEAHLYAALEGEPSLVDLALPLDEPLYNPSSWWTGEEFVIVGLPCPKWTDPSEPPDPVDESLTGFSEVCGNDAYQMVAWAPATKEWRSGPRDFLRTGAGVFLRAHGGDVAVLAVPTGDVTGSFYKLNTVTASATLIPDIPVAGITQVCVAKDGRLRGIGLWSGSTVSADGSRQVPSEWPEERIIETAPGEHLAVVALDGDEWTPTEVDAASIRAAAFRGGLTLLGCLNDDQLVLGGSLSEPVGKVVPVIVTFDSGGGARLEMDDLGGLPSPDPFQPTFILAVDRTFSAFIAYEHPHSGDRFLDIGTEPVSQLEAGSWKPFSPTQIGEDWTFVVAGDSLISFVARPDLASGSRVEVTHR